MLGPSRQMTQILRRAKARLAQRLRGRPPRFVFIIAIGRSGSTLMQGVLNAMPGACIRGENTGLALSLFLHQRDMKAQQQQPRSEEGDAPNIAWYGVSDWQLATFIQECWASAHRNIFRFPPRADLVGFKEIRFPFESKQELLDYCSFLRELEPNSLILFNVRNASEVARSGWWREEPAGIVEIRTQKAVLEAAASEVPASLLLNYSDYVDNAELLARRLQTLGLDTDPAVIERVFSVEHSYNGNRFKSRCQGEHGDQL